MANSSIRTNIVALDLKSHMFKIFSHLVLKRCCPSLVVHLNVLQSERLLMSTISNSPLKLIGAQTINESDFLCYFYRVKHEK